MTAMRTVTCLGSHFFHYCGKGEVWLLGAGVPSLVQTAQKHWLRVLPGEVK